MKLIFVLALACLAAVADADVSCLNIGLCATDIAAAQQMDKEEACDVMSDAVDCLRGALDDCRQTNALPQNSMDQLDMQFANVEQMLEQKCGRQNVKCQDIATCMPAVTASQSQGQNSDTAALCQTMENSMACFHEAVADCQEQG